MLLKDNVEASFCPQVYLTVLKHGDSATLDTMLKVKLHHVSILHCDALSDVLCVI